ncbi:MAG: thioesterase [Lachnospiraceae bacterium]|nr:thioesterase [Lachnospiraceae bacterium]MCM1237919.1 thioesterase [Lachnospiraceae bacterium]MCM1303322.1 thioesterase [Butyrivibrio sp.]MCM1344693.1 thioesterase [Muribaculaceae bacterium]MCM1412297.1 thioesterase [Lachnospiraceae bacterium]
MYTFDSRIRYSETDSGGKLTMASLLDYFQDCSTFHSEDIGLGVGYLQEMHQVWVLSSWQIVVERYPALCERVTIGTQPYEMKGFLGYRNFAMMAENGEYLARANSIWSLLDLDKGKPVPVSEEVAQRYGLGEKMDMEYAPRKIVIPQGGVSGEAIVVKQHHLDTNHHVNNGQFVDMAMDFLPEGFVIGQLRAEYKKQAFLDDVLLPYVAAGGDKVVVSLTDEKGAPYVVVEFSRKDII